jgi:HAMP domain-containing protein
LPDEQGRLWSAVLGLHLVVRGRLLQAQTPEGRLLLTPEQAEFARQRAEAELHRAEDELRRAEEEIERLRRELERHRDEGHSG